MNKESPECKALQTFITESNLTQVIEDLTRVTDKSASLLDVIMTSSRSIITSSGVLNDCISDHLPVYALVKMKAPKPHQSFKTIRSFKRYNPMKLRLDMSRQNNTLELVHELEDVNDKVLTFDNLLKSTLDAHAPLVTVIKIKNRPCPFVTNEIKDMMRNRDHLHRIFLSSRRQSDWMTFVSSRKLVKSALRQAEKDYYVSETLKNKNNSASLWKIINNCIPSKDRNTLVYEKDISLVADEFNSYFASVGSSTALAAERIANVHNLRLTNPLTRTMFYPADEQFHFENVSVSEVQRIVSEIPLNKSPGIDYIPTRVLKDCPPVILATLTNIINASLMSATFPTNWKTSMLIPLLKEGDHEIPSNNRPLSLLVIVSKICEKIVLNQFNSYLSSKQRLKAHQSGNKKYHSTETLNVAITDEILEAMDKKCCRQWFY